MSFKLYLESQREQHLSDADGIQMMFGTDNIVAIDFNHPSAVNTNGKFYDDMHIPFLMGTNIRGHGRLIKDIDEENHFYVIAPNVAK